MAAKKKAKKPLSKTSMKRVKGGDAFVKAEGVDGGSEAQRSMVRSITVTFNGPVT
ncbi:MAG TPA: hypothetical protein VF950_09410 [Planctomycetota bacterium]